MFNITAKTEFTKIDFSIESTSEHSSIIETTSKRRQSMPKQVALFSPQHSYPHCNRSQNWDKISLLLCWGMDFFQEAVYKECY